MPEEEDITVDAIDEGGGRCRSVLRGARSDRDSPFRKKEVGPKVSNTTKKTAVLLILHFPKPPYLLDPNGLKYSILHYF
jgi:hypothetical protein